MKPLKLFCLPFAVGLVAQMIHTSYANDMSTAHQQGMSLAQSLAVPQPASPGNVPGFAGTNLPQSQMKAHDLGEEALKASKTDEVSQVVQENADTRGYFVIDPHTDPLITASNEIVANPQKVLEEEIVQAEEGERGGEDEILTCEEAGEEYVQNCSKHLQILLKVTPEEKKVEKYCPWGPGAWWHIYPSKMYPNRSSWLDKEFDYCSGDCMSRTVTVPEKVEVVGEEWVDGCAALEELAEQGLCRYVSSSQSPKDETRLIEGKSFTRDHFEEHYQYACLKASTKSCSGLRAKGCYQIQSACKEEIDGRCVLWEQTYRCPASKASGRHYRSSGKGSFFCLSGDCTSQTYAPNGDFAQAMSYMSVLKEAGDDFRNAGCIFKGQDRRCTRHCVSFKDCCGNGKGWGVSLKLASCDADEKELAELRSKNRCIQVGTYCAEKVLGICIRKKTTFCCYGTKLAKIIQEQGKRQLGLGFGSPESPQCQGLTPEQLSKIDFSRINFSELFSEIMARTKTPAPEKVMVGIQKSMEIKAGLLKKPQADGEKRSTSTPAVQSPQPTVQPHPQNDPNVEKLQIQGRSHGEF